MNELPGSHGVSISDFLRTLHSLFHSGRSSLHSRAQCKGFPLSAPFTCYFSSVDTRLYTGFLTPELALGSRRVGPVF